MMEELWWGPQEGHKPVGSLGPVVVVPDLDPLGLQGLDLYMTLAAGALVAALPQVLCHGHVDVHIGPGGLAKLLLVLCIITDCSEVCGLLLSSVWPLDHFLHC